MEDNIKGCINRDALFSSETEDYRMPMEPDADDDVLLRMRTAKGNVDHVYYVEDKAEVEMTKARSDELFDYYEYEITVGTDQVLYHFKVVSEQDVCLYNRLGPTQDGQPCFDFKITPGFHTPEWAKGAVMYQIFVDRFCNGDESNDVESYEYVYIGRPVQKVTEWDRYPAAMDVGYFYGGDLQGIWDKLDYIKRLGVEAIYLNPIFVSPSNHKYDCQDYEHIDPHFTRIEKDGGGLVRPDATDNREADRYVQRSAGKENLEASDAFFARFVEEVHKRGMRVILDGVFNHCGSFNKWLDAEGIYEHSGDYEAGAYESKSSPYHSFFQFHDDSDQAWPYNRTYDGWWGHDTLPKLNYEGSEELQKYILNIAKKWVSPPYNVDGWRLDVAADLGYSKEYNHTFWKKFRQAVKEANPEAIILAENYGDSYDWLQGDEWDTVMNYDAFMEPVSWFLTGMEKHSDQYRSDLKGNAASFRDAIRYNSSRFYAPSLQTAMNELDNHDHSRFLTRTNGRVGRVAQLGHRAAEENINKAVLREAVIMQMTWPGAPTLYYGDEAGVCGFTDPDNRRTYPWGKEDKNLLNFYKMAIALHRRYDVLKTGSVKFLLEEYNLIAYGRFSNDEQMVMVINNNNENVTVDIPVWETGISRTKDSVMRRVMATNAIGYTEEEKEYPIAGGYLTMDLSPLEAIVLCMDKE